MYQDAFTKLDLAEVATILDRLNPALDGSVFDPVETTILAQNISFYHDYRLLDIADHSSMSPLRRFVIYGPDQYKVLNFSNEPIYALNKDVPIRLSENNVRDYVRFFFTYVRGRHGRFIITESVDDIHWKDDPPPTARKAIGKMLIPITLEKMDEQGRYCLKACMVFKDSLFQSDVIVDPQGFVTLINEHLLVEDMPVLDDTFGQ